MPDGSRTGNSQGKKHGPDCTKGGRDRRRGNRADYFGSHDCAPRFRNRGPKTVEMAANRSRSGKTMRPELAATRARAEKTFRISFSSVGAILRPATDRLASAGRATLKEGSRRLYK